MCHRAAVQEAAQCVAEEVVGEVVDEKLQLLKPRTSTVAGGLACVCVCQFAPALRHTRTGKMCIFLVQRRLQWCCGKEFGSFGCASDLPVPRLAPDFLPSLSAWSFYALTDLLSRHFFQAAQSCLSCCLSRTVERESRNRSGGFGMWALLLLAACASAELASVLIQPAILTPSHTFGLLELPNLRPHEVPANCSDFAAICPMEAAGQYSEAISLYEERMRTCALTGWVKQGHLGAGMTAGTLAASRLCFASMLHFKLPPHSGPVARPCPLHSCRATNDAMWAEMRNQGEPQRESDGPHPLRL